MSEELGDDDEVSSAPHQGAGDDVVGGSDAEAGATLVEEQGRAVFGAGPVGAFVEPAGQGGAELRVDGDLAGSLAFAVDPQGAFAGGEASSTSRATISLMRPPA